MSDDCTDSRRRELTRRTFVRASGVLAGAGVLGASGGTGAALAAEPLDPTFVNWRVLEASKVWARGYRGRADRTVAFTDTGVDARHPDVGPWNGIDISAAEEGEGYTLERVKLGDDAETVAELSDSGVIGPGSMDAGVVSEARLEFDAAGADVVTATLFWDAGESVQDLDFRLEDADGNVVAVSETFQGPERIRAGIDPKESYALVAYTYASGPTTYEIGGRLLDTGLRTTPFDGDPVERTVHGKVRCDTPSVLGWYGGEEQPLDGNGHGTHVSSIMAGSGRASEIDDDTVRTHEPRAELGPGDYLAYDVRAPAGTGVFGSAFGAAIELVIEGPDGRQLDRSTFQEGDATPHDDRTVFGSNAVVETPTVHESGTATYTVYVRPMSGEAVAVGRCQRVAVGAFVRPDETTGDRTAGDGLALHSGVAPNAGIVGFQGLSDGTAFLATNAEALAADFNLRAVNMSWGIVGGLPLGAAGGVTTTTVEDVRKIAEGGVLTVAAAGNSTTPVNSSAPALADEAISVVATGPLDGITDYSSGGVAAADEDDGGVYAKPDVTAPGGGTTDLANAAAAGDPDRPAADQPPIRDYVELAGTSMASPYVCGTSALVAQAMEEAAPAGLALPAPEETELDDVLRLKQVVLATATETAFTAAPHHKGHAPTYDHGGRDPFEGYGRVNPDAAVDAVSRDLLAAAERDDGAASATHEATLGIYVPRDSRAVAGYVVGGGSLAVDLSFSHYSGANAGTTKGGPHLDLFVYDATVPGSNGGPNVVASAIGIGGTASLEVELAEGGVYYVVGKLVNVPGAVTGYDVQANLRLDVTHEAA